MLTDLPHLIQVFELRQTAHCVFKDVDSSDAYVTTACAECHDIVSLNSIRVEQTLERGVEVSFVVLQGVGLANESCDVAVFVVPRRLHELVVFVTPVLARRSGLGNAAEAHLRVMVHEEEITIGIVSTWGYEINTLVT